MEKRLDLPRTLIVHSVRPRRVEDDIYWDHHQPAYLLYSISIARFRCILALDLHTHCFLSSNNLLPLAFRFAGHEVIYTPSFVRQAQDRGYKSHTYALRCRAVSKASAHAFSTALQYLPESLRACDTCAEPWNFSTWTFNPFCFAAATHSSTASASTI